MSSAAFMPHTSALHRHSNDLDKSLQALVGAAQQSNWLGVAIEVGRIQAIAKGLESTAKVAAEALERL